MYPNHGLGIQWKVRLLLGMLLGSITGVQPVDAMLPTEWIPATDEKQPGRPGLPGRELALMRSHTNKGQETMFDLLLMLAMTAMQDATTDNATCDPKQGARPSTGSETSNK